MIHPPLLFNNISVNCTSHHYIFVVYLDEHITFINFNEHITIKIGKAKKGINIIKKIITTFSQHFLTFHVIQYSATIAIF